MTTAKLELNGQTYEFPVITGSEGEVGVDCGAPSEGELLLLAARRLLGRENTCKTVCNYHMYRRCKGNRECEHVQSEKQNLFFHAFFRALLYALKQHMRMIIIFQ